VLVCNELGRVTLTCVICALRSVALDLSCAGRGCVACRLLIAHACQLQWTPVPHNAVLSHCQSTATASVSGILTEHGVLAG
jgi:hypothetical protein